MFKKVFKDRGNETHELGSLARTLNPDDVCGVHDDSMVGLYTFTHPDGWTVSGRIHEDYFYWVNDFEAHHPLYGKVWGNFEDEVFADNELGYHHFVKHHPFHVWDYWDI